MEEPVRVTAEEARKKVSSGKALLVCAYEDEARCRRIQLEGAIPLKQLESMATSLPKDREIIFY